MDEMAINGWGRRRPETLAARGQAIGGLLLALMLTNPDCAAINDIDATDIAASSQGGASPVETKTRVAHCSISSGGSSIFDGRCKLQPFDSRGSFNIAREDERVPLSEDLLLLTVTVTGKRSAQISAVTTGGHLSRWGAARLSKKSKACWLGEDFRICTR